MTRRRALAALLAVLLSACSGGRTAARPSPGPASVTVLTRNLYLGGDLRLLTRGTRLDEINADITAVLAQVRGSDPPRRMAWVADEIAAQRVDVVALQEVATWRLLGGTTPVTYDFLQLLLDALSAKGLHYRVGATQTNFDTTVALAGIPLPLTYADRDVILVREGTGAPTVVGNGAGRFTSQLRQPATAINRTLDFRRGYVWVDLDSNGRRWRLVDTHAEAFPGLTAATYHDYGGDQGAELAASVAAVRTPLVLAGDLNSARGESARRTYAALVDRGHFTDAWLQANGSAAGLTCCRNATLSGGALSERIDHVLVRGGISVDRAVDVGVPPLTGTAPRWPSDHAGVATALTVR